MYSITLAKTLTRRIDVDDADDFESAIGWARDHLGEIGFGEEVPFWIEALDDGGGDSVVAQGVEGQATPHA